MAGRTRALRLPVDHPALRVEPAHAVLEAGIRAHPVLAAPFVRLAVVVPMALQLVALSAWLPLEPFRAQANRPVVRHAAQSVDSARRPVRRARVLALAIDARQGGRTVGVRSATDQAQTLFANVSLWTIVVNVTLDATFSRMARFTARALILAVATLRAEADLVAFAAAVAGDHGFRATDQCIPVIIGRATALRHVIRHPATRAFAASSPALARIFAFVVYARLVVWASVIATTSDIA